MMLQTVAHKVHFLCYLRGHLFKQMRIGGYGQQQGAGGYGQQSYGQQSGGYGQGG